MDEVHYLQDPYRGGRLGGGADPSAARRSRGVPVGDDLQRRGVRRVDRDAPRRDARRDRGEAPGAARAPLPGRSRAPSDARRTGRHAAAEPVRRLARPARRSGTRRTTGGVRARAQHQRIPRPREGHRRVYVPRREEVVEVLADAGHAPGDLLRVQPGRVRPERRVADGRRGSGSRRARRPTTDPRAFAEMRVGVDGRGGPRDPRLLRLPGRAWRRGSPRTTPGCSRCSRRRSRSCSRPGS